MQRHSSTLRRAGILAAAAVLSVAAAGCATQSTANYSQLTGQRWLKTELNTYPVAIISVDGQHYIERANAPILVEPGVRTVVVQAPPANGFVYGEQRSLQLQVQPCTRYWLEAKKPSPLAQDFEPRINYSEPIAGCRPGAAS